MFILFDLIIFSWTRITYGIHSCRLCRLIFVITGLTSHTPLLHFIGGRTHYCTYSKMYCITYYWGQFLNFIRTYSSRIRGILRPKYRSLEHSILRLS